MKKIVQTLLVLWVALATHAAAGQAPGKRAATYCGTTELTKEYLAAHPETAKRIAAIEAHTQRYIQ